MEFDAGHVIGGKYRLFKPLAKGGMGAIWVARHMELDVAVAVKLIGSDMVLSQTAIARFRQEARAAAQLRSPHVVQILDYGIENGVPFMAMELLSGEDLDHLLQSRGRLPLARVREILTPVCKALKLAHAARIVHRDLKPANIYLARVGDDEVVKVLDFGIAKALSPDVSHAQTGSATLIGSPPYMSPEQSRGDPVDQRTDLWSLAVVAFEALTGDTPFQGRGLGDVFGQICHAPTPLPSQRGVIGAGLDEFFQKALAKDREQRFATATELLAALDRCSVEGAEVAPQVVSRDAPTLDLPIDRGEPAVARSERGTGGTNAAVSAEVARISPAASSAGRPRWLARNGWWVAAVAVAAGAGTALLGGVFDRRRAPEELTVTATSGEASAAPRVAVDLAPGGMPATAPSAPNSTPRPLVASASASSAPSASVAITIKRPPPVIGGKPVVSATVTPTATTDPLFGISPDKKK